MSDAPTFGEGDRVAVLPFDGLGADVLAGLVGTVVAPEDDGGLVFVRLDDLPGDAAWELFAPGELSLVRAAGATTSEEG